MNSPININGYLSTSPNLMFSCTYLLSKVSLQKDDPGFNLEVPPLYNPLLKLSRTSSDMLLKFCWNELLLQKDLLLRPLELSKELIDPQMLLLLGSLFKPLITRPPIVKYYDKTIYSISYKCNYFLSAVYLLTLNFQPIFKRISF